MSEPLLELNEDELLRERQVPSTVTESQLPSRSLNAEASNSTNQPGQDLVDTFQLFRSYLDHKLLDLKADILSEQKSFTKKFREDAGIKFKSEGNRIQFRLNEDIHEGLQNLQRQVQNSPPSSAIVGELISKLKDRNKLIRIADNSAGGWATVREYESSDIADNDEYDKRIREAESRALRIIKDKKSRPQPYTTSARPPSASPAPPAYSATASVPAYQDFLRLPPPIRNSAARRESCPWDICHLCKQLGHWRKNYPLNFKTTGPTSQPNASSKQ